MNDRPPTPDTLDGWIAYCEDVMGMEPDEARAHAAIAMGESAGDVIHESPDDDA